MSKKPACTARTASASVIGHLREQLQERLATRLSPAKASTGAFWSRVTFSSPVPGLLGLYLKLSLE